VSGAELAYRYLAPSAVRRREDGSDVLLSTSGGVTDAGPAVHPYFFSGLLTTPAEAAAGMLACAAVARSRYFIPGSVLAPIISDPVVTSNADCLRFESFSGCCGVHARLDLLPEALASAPLASGTTNVDFNPEMRGMLGGVAGGGPLLLSVGSGEVTVDTATDSVTERKVPLPERWLKGFGEVQALAQGMRLAGELTGVEAQRFVRSLPRTARRPLWARPSGRTFALSLAAGQGAVCIAGPQRLAELGPLLRYARRLRAYGPEVGPGSLEAPSAWELDLGAVRFTLTLSPEKYRGFSGEGALLELLADPDVAADADLVRPCLTWDGQIDQDRIGAAAGLDVDRVRAALGFLAAAGRVGYDLAEESFFHRELPFGPALDAMHPRLASARELITSGAVTLSGAGATVRSGDTEHRVTFGPAADRCTCTWWGKHRGTRGPCKHALAARIAANEAIAADSQSAAR
jgi:SWIM zinc finger